MNQIKYILSACLILLMIFMGTFLYKTFPESGIIAQDKPVNIDAEPNINSTAVAPQTELSRTEMEGKFLFQENCGSCHAINNTDNFLLGFENRRPWMSRKELHKWIHNPQEYMLHDTTGYSIRLKEVYGVSMPPFPQLSDNDIDKILDYLTKAGS